MFDVLIIGGGIIGCAIARELSKFDCKIVVLEKDYDVSTSASKANSGIVHAGYDPEPNKKKAKFNVLGNKIYPKLAKVLDFPFRQIGALTVCFDESELASLENLLERGKTNGVEGLEIFNHEKLLSMEKNLNSNVKYGLWAPTSGVVMPYEATIAFAENAAQNGVNFLFNQQVNKITKSSQGFIVETNTNTFESKIIVNAAGVFADETNNQVSENKIKIIARKGQYCVLNKNIQLVNTTIFQLPSKLGKGVLVTPTAEGNILIGPNAEDTGDKEDVSTTIDTLEDILDKAGLSVKDIPNNQIIRTFAGLRAHSTTNDFIIGESEDVKGFFNVAGIESPGVTSAPAIALEVSESIAERLYLSKNKNFIAERQFVPRFRNCTKDEQTKLKEQDPLYQKIICRCENVTEAEVMAAVHMKIGATDCDSLKRRARCGNGMCQGAYCGTFVPNILSQEFDVPVESIKGFQKSLHVRELKLT